MSELSFEDYEKSVHSIPQSSAEYASMNANRPQVGFFTLKNDGEEATVRILYDSPSEIKVVNTHNVSVPSSKFPKRVNCLKEANDAVSKCPFCENYSVTPLVKKIYVKILQYTKNADGTINTEAKIWERPAKFGFKLRDIMNNYGPLSEQVCKIVRHGAAGSTDTDYQILPNLSKQVYPDNLFPKKAELFEGYNPIGRVVLNKTFADAQAYFANGDFPAKATPANTNSNTVNSTYVANNYAPSVNTASQSFVDNQQYTTAPQTVVPPVAPVTQQFTPPTPSAAPAWTADPNLPF